MYTTICWYLCILPVLHRPDVVDIGVNTIWKKCRMPKGLKNLIIFLRIRHGNGDLCKHLGIDSSTNLGDRYSIGTRIYS